MTRTTTSRLSTSRRWAAVLAAGIAVGALAPTSAHALTPPAPDGPGGFTLPPADPGEPDPHPFPGAGAADDFALPTDPEDPCDLLGIGCPDPGPGEPGPAEPGPDADPGQVGGGGAAEADPRDDTVQGRPDFTG